MSSSQASPGPPATPPAGGGGPGDAAPGSRSSSMIQTAPGGRSRRRHMKRTRSVRGGACAVCTPACQCNAAQHSSGPVLASPFTQPGDAVVRAGARLQAWSQEDQGWGVCNGQKGERAAAPVSQHAAPESPRLNAANRQAHQLTLPRVLCWLVTAPVKAQSKPMCEILARLTAGGEFEVVLFGDKVSAQWHAAGRCCLSALS